MMFFFQDTVKYRIEDNVLKGVGFPLPKVEYTSLGEMALDNLTSNPDFVGQVNILLIYRFIRSVIKLFLHVQLPHERIWDILPRCQ